MLKVLVVEDEIPARVGLSDLVEKYNDKLRYIGYADTGNVAIERINAEKPDVLFLDIHLPDMNGFDVLDAIDYQPFVIFTTAYETYAMKAFMVHSIDYLLKPLDPIRFDKAITKLMIMANRSEPIITDYKNLATLFYQSIKRPEADNMAVKFGHKMIFIDFEDISHIKADDKYSKVVLTDGKSYLSEKSLTTLAGMLPSNFIRVHRSYLVNRAHILEIQRYFKGRLMITLDDKSRTSITTSEGYTKEVKNILGL